MYQNRNFEITHSKKRTNKYCHGMGIGIILLDEIFPGFPGDMRNPSSYPFPIQYQIAKGVSPQKLILSDNLDLCFEPLLKAVKSLESMGCRAIASDCGYFAYFQKKIAQEVNIPIFLSSLLQVPWAQQLIGDRQDVGILVAFKNYIRDEHLKAVNVSIGSNYIIEGAVESGICSELIFLAEKSKFEEIGANYEKLQKQLLEVAENFVKRHPTIKILVLECAHFPPFARHIQQRLDIPVFSWGTLLDYAYSVIVHREYYGHI